MNTQELLDHGYELIERMHNDMESDSDALQVLSDYCLNNFDKAAVMLAAGVIGDAMEYEGVYEGVEQAIIEG
jgi:hypothetical protein